MRSSAPSGSPDDLAVAAEERHRQNTQVAPALRHSNSPSPLGKGSRRRHHLALAALAVALAACLGRAASLSPPDDAAVAKPIYLVSHGWHTRLAVRRADVPVEIWPESRAFGDVEHVEVGWGDREFYQAEQATVAMALRAGLVPGPAVLHVAGLPGPICEARAGLPIVRFDVAPRGFEALVRVIHDSYERDERDRPIATRHGYDSLSHFYLATGSYHAFHTSNTWVAEALRAAGVPVTPALSFFAASLMAQARGVGTPACTTDSGRGAAKPFLRPRPE